MGFNPTDDGFTLAYTRRILEGQIPHRDFITIRPIGSPLLHLPVLYLGGDYTFWLSRLFVWIQFGSISWLWVNIISHLLEFPLDRTERIRVALVTFVGTIHTFPLMAWHTIDGLFFLSLGLGLCVLRGDSAAKMFGYLLMGFAYICKQSFVLLPLATILILKDATRIRYWIAAAIPGVIYILFLALTGSIRDGILQLTSRREFLTFGLVPYLNAQTSFGILAGYFASWLVSSMRKQENIVGIYILTAGPLLALGVALTQGTLPAFGLFGLLAGAILYGALHTSAASQTYLQSGLICALMVLIAGWALGISLPLPIPSQLLIAIILFVLYLLARKSLSPNFVIRGAVMVLIVSWASSLSVGYSTPALGAGLIVCALLALANHSFRLTQMKTLSPILWLLTFTTLASFAIARAEYIYRDLSKSHLTQPVSQVLPGFKMIQTNPNTFEYIKDLNKAVELAKRNKMSYIILPDFACYWVRSPDLNPAPIDWPYREELTRQELFDRVTRSLYNGRSHRLLIVSKVDTAAVPYRFRAISTHYYPIVDYIRKRFKKIGETALFDLYQ